MSAQCGLDRPRRIGNLIAPRGRPDRPRRWTTRSSWSRCAWRRCGSRCSPLAAASPPPPAGSMQGSRPMFPSRSRVGPCRDAPRTALRWCRRATPQRGSSGESAFPARGCSRDASGDKGLQWPWSARVTRGEPRCHWVEMMAPQRCQRSWRGASEGTKGRRGVARVARSPPLSGLWAASESSVHGGVVAGSVWGLTVAVGGGCTRRSP